MPASTYHSEESLDKQRHLLMQLLRATGLTQARLAASTGARRSHISNFIRNTPGGYLSRPKLQQLMSRLGWLPEGTLDPLRIHRWIATAGLTEFLDQIAPRQWRVQALHAGRPSTGHASPILAAWVGKAPVVIQDTGHGADAAEEMQRLLARGHAPSGMISPLPEPKHLDAKMFARWAKGKISRAEFEQCIGPAHPGVPEESLPDEWQGVVATARRYGLSPIEVARIIEDEMDFRGLTQSEHTRSDQDALEADEHHRAALRRFASQAAAIAQALELQ